MSTNTDEWNANDASSFKWSDEEMAVLDPLLATYRTLNKGQRKAMVRDLKKDEYPDGYFRTFPVKEPLLAAKTMRVRSIHFPAPVRFSLTPVTEN